MCFVTACVIPKMSASWKPSRPMSDVGTCAVRATTGVESIIASGEAGDEVRGARAGRREADAGAARGPREPLGRVRGALLVPHQEVADPGVS